MSNLQNSMAVRVEPVFLEEQSDPSLDVYIWAYHVEIENNSNHTVQLVNRHWKITNSQGITQEINGIGVVGEQPVLKPNEKFSYTSATPLHTPSGMMLGCYEMEAETGETFDVPIPAFSLDSPHDLIELN